MKAQTWRDKLTASKETHLEDLREVCEKVLYRTWRLSPEDFSDTVSRAFRSIEQEILNKIGTKEEVTLKDEVFIDNMITFRNWRKVVILIIASDRWGKFYSHLASYCTRFGIDGGGEVAEVVNEAYISYVKAVKKRLCEGGDVSVNWSVFIYYCRCAGLDLLKKKIGRSKAPRRPGSPANPAKAPRRPGSPANPVALPTEFGGENERKGGEHERKVRVRVQEALSCLDNQERCVLVLRFFWRMGWPEISRELGLSPAGCKHVYRRAIEKIRRAFQDDDV